MPNPWGYRPNQNKDSLIMLILGILIFGIIIYLIFPNLFSNFFSLINPTNTIPSSNNINPSNQNLYSSDYSNQVLPNMNNNLTIGNGNNGLSSGYSLLFVSNGQFQQLTINAQEYTFIQELIQNDKNGTPTTEIFLVENGQIQKYLVSNEINTIITNVATIIARSSNLPTNSTPPITTAPATTTPTVTPPLTVITETITVSNVSTTGFTISLSPSLNSLTINNFTLLNSSGAPITLSNVTTSNGGASYTVSAALSAGQTYTLTTTATGYTFGSAQNVMVP